MRRGDAVTLIDGARATIDVGAGRLTIDGQVMNGSKSKVNLKVLDSKGKDRYEGQITSSETGSFQFTIKLTGNLKGADDAYLWIEGMSTPVKFTFDYSKKN
ncbi:hypothetical protein [Paenibacillus sp. S-12]|uniref:hypothetical protein n=1 Tax=Paenibacillus sp. S-12 TaxID=3031371 RepID=UPI0025A23C41|nr:hypothetical protein [Paenibacillus sp. S-12]